MMILALNISLTLAGSSLFVMVKFSGTNLFPSISDLKKTAEKEINNIKESLPDNVPTLSSDFAEQFEGFDLLPKQKREAVEDSTLTSLELSNSFEEQFRKRRSSPRNLRPLGMRNTAPDTAEDLSERGWDNGLEKPSRKHESRQKRRYSWTTNVLKVPVTTISPPIAPRSTEKPSVSEFTNEVEVTGLLNNTIIRTTIHHRGTNHWKSMNPTDLPQANREVKTGFHVVIEAWENGTISTKGQKEPMQGRNNSSSRETMRIPFTISPPTENSDNLYYDYDHTIYKRMAEPDVSTEVPDISTNLPHHASIHDARNETVTDDDATRVPDHGDGTNSRIKLKLRKVDSSSSLTDNTKVVVESSAAAAPEINVSGKTTFNNTAS